MNTPHSTPRPYGDPANSGTRRGAPYGLWVHGNNAAVGAVYAVDKLATGLGLEKAADVLELSAMLMD